MPSIIEEVDFLETNLPKWAQQRRRTVSESGSRTKPKYSARHADDGRLVLDEVGVIDVYADIQSFKDSCEVQNILAQFNAGDSAALSRVQGFYADVSDLPMSPVEMLRTLDNAKATFDGLAPVYKERFGNSYTEFLAASSDPEMFFSRFDSPMAPEPVPVVEPVAAPVDVEGDSVE